MDSSDRPATLSNEPTGATVRVLCLYGSPRIRGNTDLLLDAFAQGVEEGGGVAERVYLRDLKISPCREIYACKEEGRCALRDDMQSLYEALRDTHAIALASPVMFYSVSAHTKAFIDRCQAFWSLKYLRGKSANRTPLAVRKGVFLSVGGSAGAKIFDGPLLTFRYFLDTLDAAPWRTVTCREVDEKGAILRRPEALEEARNLGTELVAAVKADLAEASHGATQG
ncbi:MAG: flavodoxin family protein [Deferrisomatales bacterium]|nr:flavodoxin family protein [Deferrisomatales bacterium]